jgi:hypothetical protein
MATFVIYQLPACLHIAARFESASRSEPYPARTSKRAASSSLQNEILASSPGKRFHKDRFRQSQTYCRAAK